MADTGEPLTIEFGSNRDPFLHLPKCPPTDEVLLVSNQEQLDRITELQKRYELEMRENRAFVYDSNSNQHFLLYRYAGAEDEFMPVVDDPEVAFLTLFEQYVNDLPQFADRSNLVEDFWDSMSVNKDFEAMRKRLDKDYIEKLVFKSFMEEITGLDPYLRPESALLAKKIKDLESENVAIAARLGQEDISTLELKFVEDIKTAVVDPEIKKFDAFMNPTFTEVIPKKPRIVHTSRRTKAVCAFVATAVLTPIGFAACSGNDGTQSASPTLPPMTTEFAPSTTVIETTTTLLQDCKKTWTVEEGDSLFSIAEFCKISIQSIQALNPLIDDPEIITIGQLLEMPNQETQYTLPPTTTTPETTTTPPVETVPPTVPPTVVTTIPPAPPTTVEKVVSDGALSPEQCTAYGGTIDEAVYGSGGLIEQLMTVGGYTKDQAYFVARNEAIKKKYKIEVFTATYDKEGVRVSVRGECLPPVEEVIEAMSK